MSNTLDSATCLSAFDCATPTALIISLYQIPMSYKLKIMFLDPPFCLYPAFKYDLNSKGESNIKSFFKGLRDSMGE